MTIYEVLEKHPESAEIMQEFGLYCVGCHMSAFETVEQGVLGHGMPKKTLNELLKALNKSFDKSKKDQKEKGIHLTERAALKTIELSKEEGHKKPGLRVTVEKKKDEMIYTMDFEEKAKKQDHILKFAHNVTLYIDPKSFKNLKGSTIDYIANYEAEGFKIENPNE